MHISYFCLFAHPSLLDLIALVIFVLEGTSYTAFPPVPCYPVLLPHTRVGTLIVATIYLQLIQNRYMFRSFTVLQCSHQHCVPPVASDVEVVGYL